MNMHKILCATILCGTLSLAAPNAAEAAGCGNGHESGSGHAAAGCGAGHHAANNKSNKHAEQKKRTPPDRHDQRNNDRNSGSSDRGSSDRGDDARQQR